MAVDASCARVMGLQPERMTFLQMAQEFLGNLDSGRIEQRGEELERFRTSFAVLSHLDGLKA